jgi:signal recognition particle subunit SRP54
MFEGLQDKLQGVFRRLRAEGRVSSEHVQRAMREIRLALLEADVHYRVVRGFVERIQERALGQEVLASLTPDQQVLKIVRDELIALLGDEGSELRLDGRPSVVLLCGLQGSGKTTTAGKLARRLAGMGRHPALVAADLQRMAAIEQLSQVGEGVGVSVFTPQSGEEVLPFVERARQAAREGGHDVVIVDTAGRLHVDDALMAELQGLAHRLAPTESLLVCDSMTGQDAVRSAGDFAQAIPLTGVILTKLDGDSRGGAALSIKSVANLPIRFVGVGEKSADLELFQPERLASRILGMGDVLSLIEKAETALDQAEAERLAQRIARREFTLEDLGDQLRQIRRLGPLSQLLELLPKVGPLKGLDPARLDDRQLVRIQAMIDSMTPRERRQPGLLNASRKRRVARGSGTTVQEINRLLKQYRGMRRLMKQVKGSWMKGVLGGS